MSVTEDIAPIGRALISVSDKAGLTELGATLQALEIQILSTGGTARALTDAGIEVIEVSAHTGFPEIMDGRVKTLHPKIHGGLLSRRGVDDAVMAANDIAPIDLLVVNLYPFEQTVARADCTFADAIENIDIGGPAMLRAAAKNHAHTAVVIDPGDYADLIEALQRDGGLSELRRRQLAAKVFANTARYDGAIANYLNALDADLGELPLPDVLSLQFTARQPMRYGENPHQQAAFYRDAAGAGANVANAEQLQGKALSYNNVADTDAALECVKQFEPPACVIVKHANPCGVALGDTVFDAYESAYRTDPTSAFGGIIAFNRELDERTATAIIERQFVEVIIAPSLSAAARTALQSKENVRVLVTGVWSSAHTPGFDFKRVTGGLLVQDRDNGMVSAGELRVVSRLAPTDAQMHDLLFAWQVAKFVKSNAIVYARDTATIGVGAGQMSRVYSARIAGIKAADEGLQVPGSVMASDAFFPFRDGIDAAHEAGIVAVIQPGGAMRDEQVIAAVDEHDMTMMFTGMRHFRH